MSEPLSFLPLAIAAGDGAIDGVPARALVAAGLTLLQRTPGLVRALQGRRAAILLPTCPQFLVALAAAEGRGAVLINPLAAPPEIAHQLADADVGAVFTSGALAARLPAGMPRVILDGAPAQARWTDGNVTREVDLGSHVGLHIEGERDVHGAEEEATILYTSAMAGEALGAICTHRNLLSNAWATVAAARLTRDDVSLAILPFSHMFGLVVSGVAPLLAGGKVACMERFHPVKAIERLESEHISLVAGVPAVYAAMAAVLARRGRPLDAPRLATCICGGAPLAVSLQEEWARLTGVELRQGYGLTEAGPVCLFNGLDAPNRRGTMGRPFPGVEVAIHGADSGDPLPDETVGEICVAGENVSPGYVGDRTTGLARRGKWLRTGDLGVRHADGGFSFRGLLKPMFTRNGFNIYPNEIVRVVGAMPGVREVSVAAIPDAMRENDIAIAVVGDVNDGEVKTWCEERLSAYKQPAVVTVFTASRPA